MLNLSKRINKIIYAKKSKYIYLLYINIIKVVYKYNQISIYRKINENKYKNKALNNLRFESFKILHF